MIKILLDEFVSKFYQVIIVVLVCLNLSLIALSVIQTIRLKSAINQLDVIESKHLAEKEKEKSEYLEDLMEKQGEINEISSEYEALKQKQLEGQRVIYKTVEKIVDRPIYRNVCIDDDGLSEINKAVNAYDPKQSASALSKTP